MEFVGKFDKQTDAVAALSRLLYEIVELREIEPSEYEQ